MTNAKRRYETVITLPLTERQWPIIRGTEKDRIKRNSYKHWHCGSDRGAILIILFTLPLYYRPLRPGEQEAESQVLRPISRQRVITQDPPQSLITSLARVILFIVFIVRQSTHLRSARKSMATLDSPKV